MISKIEDRNLLSEVEFQTSRSSGKGGQHVNTTNTKVELRFNIPESTLLTDEEKTRLTEKLQSKLTKEGVLVMTSEEERSQEKKKKKVVERFYRSLEKSLKKEKKRIPTKPSKDA